MHTPRASSTAALHPGHILPESGGIQNSGRFGDFCKAGDVQGQNFQIFQSASNFPTQKMPLEEKIDQTIFERVGGYKALLHEPSSIGLKNPCGSKTSTVALGSAQLSRDPRKRALMNRDYAGMKQAVPSKSLFDSSEEGSASDPVFVTSIVDVFSRSPLQGSASDPVFVTSIVDVFSRSPLPFSQSPHVKDSCLDVKAQTSVQHYPPSQSPSEVKEFVSRKHQSALHSGSEMTQGIFARKLDQNVYKSTEAGEIKAFQEDRLVKNAAQEKECGSLHEEKRDIDISPRKISSRGRGRSRSPSGSQAGSPSRNRNDREDRQPGPSRCRDREQVMEDRHHRQYRPYDVRYGRDRGGIRTRYDGDRNKPEANFNLVYNELQDLLSDHTSKIFQKRLEEKKKSLFSDKCYKNQRFRGYCFIRSRIPSTREQRELEQACGERQAAEAEKKAASVVKKEEDREPEKKEERTRLMAELLDKYMGEEPEKPSKNEEGNMKSLSDLQPSSTVSAPAPESSGPPGSPVVESTVEEQHQSVLIPTQVSRSPAASTIGSGGRSDTKLTLENLSLIIKKDQNSLQRTVFFSPLHDPNSFEQQSLLDTEPAASTSKRLQTKRNIPETLIQVSLCDLQNEDGPTYYQRSVEIVDEIYRQGEPICAYPENTMTDVDERKQGVMEAAGREQWGHVPSPATQKIRSVCERSVYKKPSPLAVHSHTIAGTGSPRYSDASAKTPVGDEYPPGGDQYPPSGDQCTQVFQSRPAHRGPHTPVSDQYTPVDDQNRRVVFRCEPAHRGPHTPPGPCPEDSPRQRTPEIPDVGGDGSAFYHNKNCGGTDSFFMTADQSSAGSCSGSVTLSQTALHTDTATHCPSSLTAAETSALSASSTSKFSTTASTDPADDRVVTSGVHVEQACSGHDEGGEGGTSGDALTGCEPDGSQTKLNMDHLVHQIQQQLQAYIARVEQAGQEEVQVASPQPTPPHSPRPEHRRRHRRRHCHRAPWKLRLWPYTPIAITFEEDRNPDYRPHPSLVNQGDTVKVTTHGADPRLAPNRPVFVPGGKSKLTAPRPRKRRVLTSIKVVQDIPLEPGRDPPKDPRHPFRSNVDELDLLEREDVDGDHSATSGTDVDKQELESTRRQLSEDGALVSTEVDNALTDLDSVMDDNEDIAQLHEEEMPENQEENASGKCSQVIQPEHIGSSVKNETSVCEEGESRSEQQNSIRKEQACASQHEGYNPQLDSELEESNSQRQPSSCTLPESKSSQQAQQQNSVVEQGKSVPEHHQAKPTHQQSVREQQQHDLQGKENTEHEHCSNEGEKLGHNNNTQQENSEQLENLTEQQESGCRQKENSEQENLKESSSEQSENNPEHKGDSLEQLPVEVLIEMLAHLSEQADLNLGQEELTREQCEGLREQLGNSAEQEENVREQLEQLENSSRQEENVWEQPEEQMENSEQEENILEQPEQQENSSEQEGNTWEKQTGEWLENISAQEGNIWEQQEQRGRHSHQDEEDSGEQEKSEEEEIIINVAAGLSAETSGSEVGIAEGVMAHRTDAVEHHNSPASNTEPEKNVHGESQEGEPNSIDDSSEHLRSMQDTYLFENMGSLPSAINSALLELVGDIVPELTHAPDLVYHSSEQAARPHQDVEDWYYHISQESSQQTSHSSDSAAYDLTVADIEDILMGSLDDALLSGSSGGNVFASEAQGDSQLSLWTTPCMGLPPPAAYPPQEKAVFHSSSRQFPQRCVPNATLPYPQYLHSYGARHSFDHCQKADADVRLQRGVAMDIPETVSGVRSNIPGIVTPSEPQAVYSNLAQTVAHRLKDVVVVFLSPLSAVIHIVNSM
ncbi:hypothetical protein ACOMHN_024332 [Nucella lapillus]